MDYKKENIYARCPFCDHSEWGVSLKDNHPWNCFRKSKCGASGGVYKLLKKLNRLDLIGNNGIQPIKYDERLENIIERKIEERQFDLNMKTITPPLGWKRVYSNYYLENRGFESFDKYEVGVSKLDRKLKDHVITLIREAGEIKAYIARLALNKVEIKTLEDKVGRKVARYKNSETDFSQLLVGYDEITIKTNTIILVEGLYGKDNVDKIMKLDEQEEVKCCSTSGAKISSTQIFKLQLKGIKNIIVFFDVDVINKIKKHTLDLLNEFESVNIAFSQYKDKDGYDKDPADLTEEEMFQVFENLTDPIKFNFDKVQVLNLK